MNVIGTWFEGLPGPPCRHGLRHRGCLRVRKQRITAPLAPEGVSWENRYTLNPPFGPRGRISTAASASR